MLYCTTIPLMKPQSHMLLEGKKGMCHHMVTPTLFFITDIMNLEADPA